MGKPRRPRGPRSTWEPAAPPDRGSAPDRDGPVPAEAGSASAAAETQAAETPDVESPDIETSGTELAAPAMEAAPAREAAVEPDPVPSLFPIPDSGAASAPGAASGPAEAPAAATGALPAIVPTAAAPTVVANDEGPVAPFTPIRRKAAPRIAFAPERLDLAGIGATLAGYVRGEGAAAAAHLRALTGARSPADVIRLQVGEVQRAADASLTCWSAVARKASRVFALR